MNRPSFAHYADFYRFYLTQHAHPWTRRLHGVGTLLGLAVGVYFLARGPRWLAVSGVAIGYAFAWVSHFAIEKNKPATFGHPFWSFISDFRMLGETLRTLGRKE